MSISSKRIYWISSQDVPLEGLWVKIYYALESDTTELLSEIFSLTLFPEGLESFFTSWTNRTSPRPLSLNLIEGRKCWIDNDNIETIEKYAKLDVVKNFKIIDKQEEECI